MAPASESALDTVPLTLMASPTDQVTLTPSISVLVKGDREAFRTVFAGKEPSPSGISLAQPASRRAAAKAAIIVYFFMSFAY